MQEKTILLLSLISLIAIAAAAGLAMNDARLTGFATGTGTANLTVLSVAEINFTDALIEWGTGMVSTGKTFAVIDTEGNVIDGNWTAQSDGFTIENIGNVNVTLALKAGKTATDFIGGTSPAYTWKVSDNEEGSCVGNNITAYAPTDVVDIGACDILMFESANDAIDVDLNLTIPSNSKTGALTDTITATGTAA